MRNRFGEQVQDNYTGDNERQPEDCGKIESLPESKPGDERDQYDADAGPDRIGNPNGHRAQSKRKKKEGGGIAGYHYN